MPQTAPFITSHEIVRLSTALESLGISIWIDGGWCVDALLGEQTRPHKDLDIAVDQKEVTQLLGFLTQEGYQQTSAEGEFNIVWNDNFGREIDIHVFVTDEQGNIIGGTAYPKESLTGTGTINGYLVKCISAGYMIQFMTPWISKHPEKYTQDISALCKKFGIVYPVALSPYHQKYANQTAAEIQHKADAKEDELIAIFGEIALHITHKPITVAVLGCGDRRFVAHHRKIFANVLHQEVTITTFDITIDHLIGEEQVYQHDCTLPLPRAPYAITYAHVLLKFIPNDKQFDLLKNSHAALSPGGIAIHVLDTEEIATIGENLPDGSRTVPLAKHKKELTALGIPYKEISVKYGVALVLVK